LEDYSDELWKVDVEAGFQVAKHTKYYSLHLIRSKINMLLCRWQIVHFIDRMLKVPFSFLYIRLRSGLRCSGDAGNWPIPHLCK